MECESENGFPDSDEDGLIDSEDNCPNGKGAIDNDGSPWSDSDGITDNEDKCPEELSTIENSGCPFLTE